MRPDDLTKCPRDGEGTLDNPMVIWAARLTPEQRQELAVPEFECEADLYRAIDANADMAKTAAIRAGCTIAWIICPIHTSKYVYDEDGNKIPIRYDRSGKPVQFAVTDADPHLTVRLGTSEDLCHLHGHINVILDKRGFPIDFMKSFQRRQNGHLTGGDDRSMELFEWGTKDEYEQERLRMEAADYELFKTKTVNRGRDWEIEDDMNDDDYVDANYDIEIPDYNPMEYQREPYHESAGFDPESEDYLVALLGLTLSLSVAAGQVVQIGESRISYRGTTKGSVEYFENIKFAHDTSGEKRFASPEPYTPPAGSEIDATVPGPACPQSKSGLPPFFSETPDISEDCLHLRIVRPTGTIAEDRLPVVVWLHGGGVVMGSAYDPHFDPENIIKLSASIEKPVIYVSLNYRLTIFGFASLEPLHDQKSLNVGMRDQRAGFQWIKDNIASFGGDPDSITAFGLSAGGTFISLHTLAYGGEKGVPFTKAWPMSGPPGTALNVTSDAPRLHTIAVAEKLGCQTENEKEILRCLREVPMEKLTETAMDYSVANHPPAGLFTFIPSVDGDFIPDRHTVLYKADIPLVFGWTQDDGATNVGPAASFQNEEDIKTSIKSFAHALTTEDYEGLFSLYPASDFEEDVQNYEASKAASDPTVPVHFFQASRVVRDLLFTCSSIEFGYEMSRQSKDPDFPGVRLYDLNQTMLTPLFAGAGMPYIKVAHGSDTNYIFNGVFPEGPISEEDQKLSKSMATAFINFAYTGDPTSAEDEHFSSWPESFPDSLELDKSLGSGPSSFNMYVIGGTLGSGSCRVSSEGTDGYVVGQENDGFQEPLVDSVRYAEMESKKSQMRKQEIKRQRLLERCAFISTLSERLGI
ncbi:hypothetical protein ABKA04_008813 [Annulohypoxylon sp. FPYF3050]